MINVSRERWEHRKFEFFWKGRPWNYKDGWPILSPSGFPRDLEDLLKLEKGFEAAFDSIGATEFRISVVTGTHKACIRCGEVFEVRRSTARYCPACRNCYARRIEEDPAYIQKNRQRAREGMAEIRKKNTKWRPKVGRRINATIPMALKKASPSPKLPG